MSDRELFVITPTSRERIQRIVAEAPLGTLVELRASARKRTLAQNARMWAMLTDISRQVVWYRRKLTTTEWKDVFTAALKRRDVIPGLDGSFVVLGQHTSNMTIDQMGELIELMQAFGAEQNVTFHDQDAEPWPARR